MNKKNIENIYPMTPMQQGILFHTLNAPQTGIYVVQNGYQFERKINLTAFKRAWQQVINQHPILRTSFHWQQHKEPFQVVYKRVELPWWEWRLGDWEARNDFDRQQKLQTWLKKDRKEGFNLNQAPLMRFNLIHLNNNTYQFVWSCHHLILDGWSTALVLKQVLDSYQAIVRGEIGCLKPSRPYGDYVAWLRQQDLSQAKAYWQKILQGFTAPTPLVMGEWGDREIGKWGEESLKLSLETTTALKSLAKEHRFTVNTILQGAWALLLSRYSGEDDVVFGATVSGRPPNLVGSESMVGLFINTLPVRVSVPANKSLITWLQKLQNQQIEAQQYEYTPLTQIQQWSNVPQDLPLFESILVFENYPVDTTIAEFGIEMAIEQNQSIESTNYPLTISAGLSDRLSLEILYDCQCFDYSTIQRVLGHLEHLLTEFVTKPEASLKDLSILTNKEKQQILIDWNSNQINYLDNLCIHQLFEQQVTKTPDAIAVISETQKLTYQELNQRAEELAVYLQSIGVKPEVIVGICLDRSLETIVAILAILKAGGAYLPLDPAYPQQRLDDIIQDAQISLILTQQHLKEKFPQQSIRVIPVDTQWQIVIQPQQQNLPRHVNSDNLAYVIYTSGSTGKPKGVAIAHRALVNFAQAAVQEYEINNRDKILQFASISFDASVEEIYPCLIAGSTLVLRTHEMGYSPSLLLEKCRDYGITILDLPTAFWHLLTAELANNSELQLPESIRLVIIGGEAVNPDKVASWNRVVGTSCQLINTYGPTEATVVSTSYKIPSQTNDLSSIPIGQALPNVQTYILDKNLQPVPIGVPGELHIGGVSLARGYLNNPKLTAEKFIPNLFLEGNRNNSPAVPQSPSPLVYKTGDKARYLPDGNIEFLGRIDNQVKIRGFRIELEEIETLLNQHSDVEETIVIAQKDPSGDRSLIAYLVPSQSDRSIPNETTDLDNRSDLQWQQVFNDLYKDYDSSQQTKFYIKGWNSSYTGEIMPDEQVRGWMEQTISRILALKPQRMLELGCGGSGLMLLGIAPHCLQYHATDISQDAIKILQQQIEPLKHDFSNVTFAQKPANDFRGVKAGEFDAVAIVSVAQYFPSIQYLLQVLEGAVNVVESGFIFLGDIRSLPLLEAFHTSVQLERAPNSLSLSELQQRVQKQLSQERQLIVDPAFFIALQQHLPQISRVEIQLQRGKYHNELNKFRYDVVLHIGAKVPTLEIPWLDWQEKKLTVSKLRQLLVNEQPEFLGITGVPNARIIKDIQATELLKKIDGNQTVSQLQEILNSQEETSIDPEDLWQLEANLPYAIAIYWSNSSQNGRFDVTFKRNTQSDTAVEIITPFTKQNIYLRSWNDYANNPQQEIIDRNLVVLLRNYLKEKLPEYMIPSQFILLEAFPLTLNGKVDRHALLASASLQSKIAATFTAPRTSTEQQMAEIWQEVLGVSQVGIYDNFFDLGGHSLLIVRLFARIRNVFKIDLPFQCLFDAPILIDFLEKLESRGDWETRRLGDKETGRQSLDLKEEAILDCTIALKNRQFEYPDEFKSIFLTGATGFLGAFLLSELLQQTEAEIYCLVRVNNLITGKQKIKQSLANYLLWQDTFSSRIIPVIGDLSQPFLGLSDAKFQSLAESIDLIYHNGAWVHHAMPYSTLKAANVLGTKEVLRLASTEKIKPVHYISTISVFSGVNNSNNQLISETSKIDDFDAPEGGYVQTKWVADKLVNLARDRGLPVTIYRPGGISGDSKTGVFNPNDFLYRLLIGCIELGAIPKGDVLDSLLPVDYISRAIVKISLQPQSLGKAFHLVNRDHLNINILTNLIRSFGYELKELSQEQWQAKITDIAENQPEHPLYPLISLLFSSGDSENTASLQFDCQNTLQALANTEISCPPMDEKLLRTYLSYLSQNGFLKPPLVKTKG
jgi:amino acid adenylation domain-containing protein/thioester reductase-like protein